MRPGAAPTRPEALLRQAGLRVDAQPVSLSGGDMGEVFRVGSHVVKLHPQAPSGLFQAEARGLRALERAGIAVPEVRWVGEAGIVLQWLGEGRADWGALGEAVARLHQTPGPRYGALVEGEPSFLGRFRLPVGEDPEEGSLPGRWHRFFSRYRLQPLLEVTRPVLGALAGDVEQVLTGFEPPAEGPVLLHGDLWSGNVVMGADGPALIDPSGWYGERAVDLAMMRLFGGFPNAFWSVYQARYPIGPQVEAALPWHQLYFLLVHVHFFGRSYLDGVRRAVAACR